MTKRLSRWAALALMALTACGGGGTAVVTAVKLRIDFGSAAGLDQVRIYANFAEGGGNILPPVVRPDPGTEVVVLDAPRTRVFECRANRHGAQNGAANAAP